MVYTIYYRRNSYTLTFKNGNETTEKGSFLYQTDISAQYFVPTYNGDDPEGYEFGGWYTTEACIPGTEWNHSGATMPYNNLILYAKWVPVTHDVKLYITKEDWENGEQYLTTITVSHNTTAQEPARPSNGSYNFVGWFYMEDGVEKAFDFDIPVRKDLNLYGKWVADELAPYTIKYAIKDTSTSDPDDLIYIADDTKGSALAGQDKTFEAKAGDELYEGYRVGYYPETNSHSMNILLDADNTYTFIYVPKDEVKYTVKYLEVGTEKVLEAQKDEVTRESVHTENFVYVEGYRPDAYQKRIVLSANESENVIIFWYEIDTEHAPVLVKHYLQNIDGDGYNKDNPYLTTTDLDGVIGNTYTVDIITNITGFNFAKAEASADTEPQEITVGNASVSAVVTAQGLLIELYYDRINYPYEFQFLEQGTNAELVDPVSGTARYGSQVTQTAIDIQGYKVNVSAQDMIIQVEDGTDAVNNVRIFYYVEETVDISYVAVGPEGATDFGSVSPESEPNIPVLSGSVSGSVASPEAAYKFVGWYSNAGCTKEVDSAWISGNKLTPQKNSSGMYESATYYAKFDYNLTSLTIEKQGHQAIDENQTFIFNISGVDVNLDVTVHGNSSVSVYGLTVGADYKITEKSSWSWRYEPVKWSFSTDAATNGETESSGEGNTADIKLGVSGNKLIFENERPTERSYWLDGDSWCDNLFN